MKRCPQCNRTYTDDALSFCLDDGSPLVSESAPPSFDPGATVQYPQSRGTVPQPTIAYGPGQTPPPPPPTPPPAWSPMPPLAPQKRSVWPWILGIGGILIFMGIGVVILLIALASINSENNNNANSNTNRLANRNANVNANTTVANANTRSTLSSFTDDFSSETWGVGPSQYGRIWYEDEEYHMHATKNGYIVMYSPDKPEYHDENATVRITLHSVDGDAPAAGYGLLVHGEKKDGQLEDYGFLLFTGTDPKYKIIEHKAGVETKLADWTSSSAIRTGTTPNQIEVRIRDLRMDFYINGQFVTSITDPEGYRRGRVGIYSSDTGEVAFDDLEISK
jgi:hypothetical protein